MPKTSLDYTYPHSPGFIAHDYYLPDIEKALVQAFTRAQSGFVPICIIEDERVVYGAEALGRAVVRMRAFAAGGLTPEEAAARVISELEHDEEKRATS